MLKLKLFLFLIIPLISGVIIGFIFPSFEFEQQKKMILFITDFAQVSLFNIVAPIAVLIFSIYVFVYGQISRNISGIKKSFLFWLPNVSLGCIVPFFTSVLGFLISYSGELETKKLAVMTVVGFVYSVVFFIGMLLPAFEGMYPKEVGQKRKLYVLLVLSLSLVTLWQYFT